MIESLPHLHLVIAAALMGGAALIARVPSVLYMLYERRALDGRGEKPAHLRAMFPEMNPKQPTPEAVRLRAV